MTQKNFNKTQSAGTNALVNIAKVSYAVLKNKKVRKAASSSVKSAASSAASAATNAASSAASVAASAATSITSAATDAASFAASSAALAAAKVSSHLAANREYLLNEKRNEYNILRLLKMEIEFKYDEIG